MSLQGVYDPGNIFAKIIKGQIPVARIYEDADVLAFMDAFPQTKGHSLVISKVSQARNILEVDLDVLADLMAGVQRVARAINAALKPDGLIIKQFNGTSAGQTVFHLHVHIIPVWDGQAPGEHSAKLEDASTLKNLSEMISAALD